MKNKLLLGEKITAVSIFVLIYLLLFFEKLYIEEGQIYFGRIIFSTITLLVPGVLLFIKIKIPEKVNLIISILFSGIVMIENFVILQISQGYNYSEFSFKLFALNMAIIGTIYLVMFALTNSFKGAIIGLNIVTVLFGLANYFLVLFRGLGFLAVDMFNIKTAASVASKYSYTLDYNIYLLLIVSFAICIISCKLGKNTVTLKWRRLIPILVALCAIIFCYNAFITSSRFDKVLKVKYFNPQQTFDKNGMYVTFIESLKDLLVEPPEGYSVDVVKEIADKYQGTPATVSEEEKPNIIVIMDEAFVDFSSIMDLNINKDCVPFFHSLEENTVKGQMFVSIYGGGTASTEFEVLTANSMAFIPNGITAYTSYINSPMSSLASILKEQDYGGYIAMHPFKGKGYKRNTVYPLLGFDEFITIDDFPADTHRMGRHISDVANVERIIQEYEEYKKENEAPFCLFNVTMQNHSPFTSSGVPNDIQLGYDADIPEAQQYVNLMRESDKALKTIVEYFEKQEEPTVIVFFGDHQPKLEKKFYKEIKKAYKLGDAYKEIYKYNTQFLIWANYDIEEQTDVYISPNYLQSLILDTAGVAKSGYSQFTSKVREEVPVITKHGHIGKDGKFYKNDDKNSPYYELLQQYNIIEYNNIFDVDNRVEEFFNVQ